MKKKYFIFILVLGSLVSCQRKHTHVAKILENNCFWDFLDPKQSNYIHDGYRFKKKWECQRFYYRFINQRRTDSVIWYDKDDNIVPNTWEVIGDTILKAQGFPMKIIRYNNDSIVIKLESRNDTAFLIRNCKTVSRSKHF